MALHVVSIHDRHPGGDLAIELRDVLDAIGDDVAKHDWIATRLECVGAPVQRDCEAVRAAGLKGVRLASARLLEIAEQAGPAQDATLFAVPPSSPPKARYPRSGFAESDATILVEAVEGSFFVVAAKDDRVVERLRARFDDVRDEDWETVG
jgi:hypothetical protein